MDAYDNYSGVHAQALGAYYVTTCNDERNYTSITIAIQYLYSNVRYGELFTYLQDELVIYMVYRDSWFIYNISVCNFVFYEKPINMGWTLQMLLKKLE